MIFYLFSVSLLAVLYFFTKLKFNILILNDRLNFKAYEKLN